MIILSLYKKKHLICQHLMAASTNKLLSLEQKTAAGVFPRLHVAFIKKQPLQW